MSLEKARKADWLVRRLPDVVSLDELELRLDELMELYPRTHFWWDVHNQELSIVTGQTLPKAVVFHAHWLARVVNKDGRVGVKYEKTLSKLTPEGNGLLNTKQLQRVFGQWPNGIMGSRIEAELKALTDRPAPPPSPVRTVWERLLDDELPGL